MAKIEPYELNATEAQKWGDTRAALLWSCPAFAHLFYSMLDNAGSKHIALFTKDPAIPIAATDGSNLILNPDGFFKRTLPERVFIVSHEILHNVFDHMGLMHRYGRSGKITYQDGKKLEYDHKQMNIAADLVINDILIQSKVGKFPVENGAPIGMHDVTMGTQADAVIDVYRKIYKKPPPKGGSFDVHLAPGTSQGKDPASAAQQRSPQKWANAIAAAAGAAKAMGKLPAGLERLFTDALEPSVDWKDKIRALMARRLGTGRYDWRKFDRRLITRGIGAPGRSGFACGTVVVAADSSGSVFNEIDMWLAEVSGILEDCKPKEIVLMWCDAAVQRVDMVEEASDLNTIRTKGAAGGGGTDFRPVFDEIQKMGLEPDALVYLTDGMGTFPDKAPSYSVIWGNITPNYKYPFGDVVDVPKQAA